MGKPKTGWLSIEPLNGEYKDVVAKILKENPQYYGEYDDETVMHAHFYQVTTKKYFVAFFCIFYWEGEVGLGCVYVFEEYRRKGVFNAILDWTLKYISEDDPRYLVINAEVGNYIANKIYSKKFQFAKVDEDGDVYWYVVREPKNARKQASKTMGGKNENI